MCRAFTAGTRELPTCAIQIMLLQLFLWEGSQRTANFVNGEQDSTVVSLLLALRKWDTWEIWPDFQYSKIPYIMILSLEIGSMARIDQSMIVPTRSCQTLREEDFSSKHRKASFHPVFTEFHGWCLAGQCIMCIHIVIYMRMSATTIVWAVLCSVRCNRRCWQLTSPGGRTKWIPPIARGGLGLLISGRRGSLVQTLRLHTLVYIL